MAAKKPKPFEIYRASEARDYGEHGIQEIVEPSPAVVEALTQFVHEGAGAGQEVSMAYSRPGFSLTKVWFKSGYPLPLHSHSGDCLYHITAGSIRVGKDVLGPGDGFFVESGVPYTYETGPEGAEVLEFRATDQMDIKFIAKGKTAWNRIIGKLRERRDIWAGESRPSETARNG